MRRIMNNLKFEQPLEFELEGFWSMFDYNSLIGAAIKFCQETLDKHVPVNYA